MKKKVIVQLITGANRGAEEALSELVIRARVSLGPKHL